jgi:hypothetical protein
LQVIRVIPERLLGFKGLREHQDLQVLRPPQVLKVLKVFKELKERPGHKVLKALHFQVLRERKVHKVCQVVMDR